MLPYRIYHRRLRDLLSQRSSVPQGNGGVFRVAPTFVLKYNIRTRSLADQRDRGRTGRRG